MSKNTEQLNKELDEFKRELEKLLIKNNLIWLKARSRIKSLDLLKNQEIFKNNSQDSDSHDLWGLRVIMRSKEECFKVGDIIKNTYEIIRYRDYITNPWKEGYQSIHIDFRANGAKSIELQIRTLEMDQFAKQLIQQRGEHYWRNSGFSKH